MVNEPNNTPELNPIPSADEITTLGGSQTAVEKASSFLSSFAANNTALVGGITGEKSTIFYPPELIGGSAPYVAGQEDEMAWQAGAESADSERVHYTWSVHNNTLWYLAVRSSDMSSAVNSWCPFAALLPGMPQAQAGPIVYLHQDDEAAMMMTIAPNMLQVHRGAAMVIQARAERMSSELGGAPIVALRPDFVDQLDPVEWRSASLMEDKARRFLATAAVATGLLIGVVAFVVWVLASLAVMGISHNVENAKQQASASAQQLLTQATNLRASALRTQIAKFIELNDGLIQIGGWLQEYRIEKGKVKWSAMLPSGVTGEKISALGGVTKEITDDGVVIEGR